MSRKKGALNKHQKVKPQKEKKQRGRPKGSMKQNQHQIVNVNVNSGDGEKKRPTSIPQIPLNIFDPSLITPHYGINDRQPVNPPNPDIPDMTSILGSIISQIRQPQPQPQPQPKPQPQPQPQQPNVPIKVEPIKIKPQHKIQKEIQGEYLGDINDIHKKHVNNKLINSLKKKYIDTEGLGFKVPIDNVIAAGTAALGGAELGALTLAADAAYTGVEALATTGSLSRAAAAAGSRVSIPSVISYVGGGAIGSGVNTALGGSKEAGIISSVVGGIATKHAVNKYYQRQAAQQKVVNETSSLLNNAKPLGKTGNKLGGKKTGKSNLIPEEQLPSDKPKETPQSMFNKVKEVTTRKAKEAKQQVLNLGSQISEGVDKVRQKISGRTNFDGRGEYTPLKNLEPIVQPKQDIPTLDFDEEYAKIPQEKQLKSKRITKQQLKATDTYTKKALQKKNAPKNIDQLSKNALQMDKDMNKIKGLEKLIIGKQKENTIANLGELSQGIIETRFKKNKQAILKQRKTISNLGELTKKVVETNKQQIRQVERPSLENASAVSNFGNLSKNAISSSKQELIKGIKNTNKIKQEIKLDNAAVTIQSAVRNKAASNKFVKQMELNQQMLLRSGTITGGTRMTAKTGAQRQAAFKERHPETTALGGQITDLKRRTPEGFVDPKTLSEKQRKLNIAKEAEGVGQAKRGRPPKAAWNTSTKSK